MVVDEILKLFLFLEQRAAFLHLVVAPSPSLASALVAIGFTLGNSCIAHQPSNIVTFLLIISPLIPSMIHTQHSPKDCRPSQIING